MEALSECLQNDVVQDMTFNFCSARNGDGREIYDVAELAIFPSTNEKLKLKVLHEILSTGCL